MGICQPDSSYIVNVKKYNRPNEYLPLTITECVNLLKAQNSSYDLFFFDPYNYPYIIGGFTLPAGITDLYFINDEKYTTYTNMVAARGENNGTAVNVLNTSMSMYVVYQDGTRLLGAGVAHNFTSRQFDGIYYREADGSYQYPYILYTSRTDINIYINNVPYKKTGTVRVNYYLPDYEYTYAKITYKQDSEPDSETDGESVEILKDETSVNIEGLEEDKTYYFKIFTDKSESEAFQYTVEVDPVPPEYKEKCIKIGSTQIGNESTREFYNSEYKLYSGTAIYDTIYNYSRKATYISRSNTVHFDSDRSQYATRFWIADDIVTISFDTTTNIATYSSINVNKNFYTSNNVNFAWFYCAYSNTSNCYTGSFTQAQTSGYNTKPSFGPSSFTTFFENGIGEFIDYIYKRFRNVNLYVDGVQWVTGSLN